MTTQMIEKTLEYEFLRELFCGQDSLIPADQVVICLKEFGDFDAVLKNLQDFQQEMDIEKHKEELQKDGQESSRGSEDDLLESGLFPDEDPEEEEIKAHEAEEEFKIVDDPQNVANGPDASEIQPQEIQQIVNIFESFVGKKKKNYSNEVNLLDDFLELVQFEQIEKVFSLNEKVRIRMTVEEPNFKKEVFFETIGRSQVKMKAQGQNRFDISVSAQNKMDHIKSEWKMHELQLSAV